MSMMQTLHHLGLHWDGPPSLQSEHHGRFTAALAYLRQHQRAYPCGCTRQTITAATRRANLTDTETRYPGTCRNGLPPGRVARAWRLRVPEGITTWHDRLAGTQHQNVATQVGDFVLRRADDCWAYQLAVVVDDAAQSITDIVRGADLLDSTARQHVLAHALGLRPPRTLHIPLVLDTAGRKLSKQTGAPAVDPAQPLLALGTALRHLGLEPPTETDQTRWLQEATRRWAQRYGPHA